MGTVRVKLIEMTEVEGLDPQIINQLGTARDTIGR